MILITSSNSNPESVKPKIAGLSGQSLVEFALIMPILLFTIFAIIELARVFFSWMAIENGARFGIRYAITREYDAAYCGGGVCSTESAEESARLLSVEDAAQAGSAGVWLDPAVTDPTVAGYYDVLVCPSDRVQTPLVDSEAYSCLGGEFAGIPGEQIMVVVDHNHKLITPILSSIWPNLRMHVRRESIVETYRYAVAADAPLGETLPEPGDPPPVPGPDPVELLPCTDPRVYNTFQGLSKLFFGGNARVGNPDNSILVSSLRNFSEHAAVIYSASFSWDVSDLPGNSVVGMELAGSLVYDNPAGSSPPIAVNFDPPLVTGTAVAGTNPIQFWDSRWDVDYSNNLTVPFDTTYQLSYQWYIDDVNGGWTEICNDTINFTVTTITTGGGGSSGGGRGDDGSGGSSGNPPPGDLPPPPGDDGGGGGSYPPPPD